MSKIKDIEVIEIGEPTGNSSSPWGSLLLLVKVITEDGYVGWGEAPTELMALSVYEEIKEVARKFIGEEVTDISKNIERVYREEYWLSISMQTTAALSAIEMASWDIFGKIHNLPVYKIFGGKVNEKVRAYANGWYDNCVTADDYFKKIEITHSLGFGAVKFDPFMDAFDNLDKKHLDNAEDIIKQIRGKYPDLDILLECHGRFNANSAIAAANRLEKYNLFFMEEPVHPDQIEGLKRFRKHTNVKVALGERILNKNILMTYLKDDLVDVIQPDISNFTGLMEGHQVAGMARTFGVEVAYHNAYGPVQNQASLNLDFTIPNFLIQESFEKFWPDWKKSIIKKSNFRLNNGYFEIVDNIPGLGFEINEDIIEKMQVHTMGPYDKNQLGWAVKGTTGIL